MKTHQHLVAIVILNYNGKDHLEKFLPSVVTHSQAYPIVVADNASTDDSVDFLKSNYPFIEVIINKENGGFAQGYNEALKYVDSEFYVLLNSDVEVTENWLDPMLQLMKSNTKIAGCQPIIKSYKHKNYFEHAGAAGGFLDKHFYPFCRGRIFDQIEEDHGQYHTTREVFWSTGACMVIRSEQFHEVGGFDTTFFAHMEEIDLCWRLKRLGFSFYVEGSSIVYHLGGGTLNYMSPKKTFLNFRNSLFMITKNYDGFLPTMLFKRMVLDGLATLQFLISGQFSHILALLQAHFSFYKHLPEMLGKRKRFKKTHAIQVNRTGLYKKSIILDRFVYKKTQFSDLKTGEFYSE